MSIFDFDVMNVFIIGNQCVYNLNIIQIFGFIKLIKKENLNEDESEI